MSVPATTFKPNPKVQDNILKYFASVAYLSSSRYNIRGMLETIDRSYMREVDFTIEQYKAKRANRHGDTTKFQNIVIPVVMPQVENAVTYQSAVFLQGYPMFGVVASPANQDAALMMDTIIGEQQIRGGWVSEYQKAFRNGFKYNILATEVDWTRERTFAIETRDNTSSAELSEVLWEGNTVKNLDLYNTFWDPRVPPAKVARDGEYAGYTELISKVALVRLLQSLPDSFNMEQALASNVVNSGGTASAYPGSYYLPMLNPEAIILPEQLAGTDWLAFVGLGSSLEEKRRAFFGGTYQITKLYARIIPKDMGITGVPGPNVPQVWKFLIVNGQVVVAAERLTNAHGFIPIMMAQPYDDGLSYQTKSLAVNVGPIQEITTAIANSTIASKRRSISDRMLYDPTRINPAHLNNDNPTSKIPVKPSAFGDSMDKAVYPIPFNENLFQFNQAELQQFLGFANMITGMNPARQGQFVKGNKTRFEFAEIMANSNGRDQAVAMSLEASLFTPTKEVIKANILQYQGGVSLYNREQETEVEVDPLDLRKAMLQFKVSDGLTPNEKLVDGESLAVAFQTIQSVPQLQQGYNVPAMFSYLMKSRGARLHSFEKSSEQLAYEQALASWQQSMAMLAQSLQGNKDITSEELQQLAEKLPPQPTPEQFGYNPQQSTQPDPQGSILAQISADSASANNGGMSTGEA